MIEKFGLNFNMLRASYITYEFSNNRAYKDRLIIANRMRHSITTALLYYNRYKSKINFIEDDDIIMDIPIKEEDEEGQWGRKTFKGCTWYSIRESEEHDVHGYAYPSCIFENLKEKLDKLLGE